MVLLESGEVSLGTPAEDFLLRGVDDKEHSLSEYKGAKALVIIFMCNHCPYVQAQWGKLIALQEKYKNQGAQFVGINPNFNPDYPEDSFEKMKEYYENYKMNFPYLQDPTQEVARKYKAQCTPDIFVYDSKQKLAYHGRADELDGAIGALVRGEKPSEKQSPSMGCSIKWMEYLS